MLILNENYLLGKRRTQRLLLLLLRLLRLLQHYPQLLLLLLRLLQQHPQLLRLLQQHPQLLLLDLLRVWHHYQQRLNMGMHRKAMTTQRI